MKILAETQEDIHSEERTPITKLEYAEPVSNSANKNLKLGTQLLDKTISTPHQTKKQLQVEENVDP